tara:strand:- start:1244 stop:2071 length:828 start_codon:yes stop_codon:yes gene_type:complete
VWHDRRIELGQEFGNEIEGELAAADIVIFLVSSDFIASDYCFSKEAMFALNRHSNREATVIPVIVRPCDWKTSPFGAIQAAPTDAKAVSIWPDRDEAWLSVVNGIRAIISDDGVVQSKAGFESDKNLTIIKSPARSGNLSIKRKITDLDKEKFLKDTFSFICDFIENSARELTKRNASIECDFERVTTKEFEIKIFSAGELAAEFTVRRSALFGDGIGISQGRSSGISAQFVIAEEDGELFYSPMLWQVYDNDNGLLQPEQVAEAIWDHLIANLN